MNPIFSFIQLFFYYPVFFFSLYIYLVFFLPIKNIINITNIFSFFSNFLKKNFDFSKK
jgi:hypothetical protein